MNVFLCRTQPARFDAAKAMSLATLSCALLLNGCGSSPNDPEPQSVETRFQAALDSLQQRHQFPGATAAFILPDGRTSTFATGDSDVEQNIAMSPTSRMLAGSIGKSFVAAVVLNLAKEGTLGLDDKLETWLGDEDWYSRLPGGDQITLDMLLHHTSGIPPEIGTVDDIDRLVEVLHAPGFDPDTVSLPIFVEGALDRESVFAPGTDFFYTDTNYLLLGMVIEKATGSTYYQEVRDRILDPLNLTHTERSTNRVIAGLATGYTEAGNDLEIPERVVENGELVYNPGFEWTGGGLVSNVGDLVRWAKALFEEQVMTEPYVEELLRGVSAGGSEQYGLGVRIGRDELGTHYRHGGFMPGYRSHFVYYPEHQIAIAVQINRDFVLVRTTGITETKDICLGCAALDLARIVLDGLN